MGYWKSRAFLAAVNLGVFKYCGTEGLPFLKLSEAVNVLPEKLKPLIGSLVELGLIEYDEMTGDVCPTKIAHIYLNPHSPACMDTSIEYAREMFSQWNNLEERLQAPLGNNPVPSKQDTPSFLQGMHNRAKMLSEAVMPLISLRENDSVLDIAAGAGTWSLLLQEKFSITEMCLLEQPELLPSMKSFITKEGLSGARFVEGDYHDKFIEEIYSNVIFFGALHQEAAANLSSCIEHLWSFVEPGGRLWILDIFAVKNDNALFAHLFGLNMLLSSDGSVFELDEVEKAINELPQLAQSESHAVAGSLPYFLIEITKKV